MAVEWLIEDPDSGKVDLVLADRRVIGTDENGVEDVLLAVPGDEMPRERWERIQASENGVRTAKTRAPRSRSK